MGCTTRQGLLADEGYVRRRANDEIAYIKHEVRSAIRILRCHEPRDLRVVADMLAEAIGDKAAIIYRQSSSSWEPRPAPVHADNQPLLPRRKPGNEQEQLLTEMAEANEIWPSDPAQD